MKRNWKIFAILIIVAAGAFLFFWDDISGFYQKASIRLLKIEKEISNLTMQEIEEKIYTPPPLRISTENPQSFLTREGVIKRTNVQREINGLPSLKESTRLDLSSEAKVQDMFDNQYFDHTSPSGRGVKDLAILAGYDFITIGENLALGNFEDDEALVQAWMDSPGHRANILNETYTEIGVAVVKGIFEGESTWLAVQHFGFPVSACPTPDPSLKAEIDLNKSEIQNLQSNLNYLQTEIQSIRPKQHELYVQRIEEYNGLVSRYNNLNSQTEALIDRYNSQAQEFNKCASASE